MFLSKSLTRCSGARRGVALGGSLQQDVYAWHGRELKGCKSLVREPCSRSDTLAEVLAEGKGGIVRDRFGNPIQIIPATFHDVMQDTGCVKAGLSWHGIYFDLRLPLSTYFFTSVPILPHGMFASTIKTSPASNVRSLSQEK
jgi:hypothetical protein